MTREVESPLKCPDREAWSAFCLGQIDPDTLQALATHLDSCSNCRETLETLRPFDDILVAELQRSDLPDPFADEPQCQEVMQRLRRLEKAERGRDQLPPPEKIGEYRILECLGRGGMGAVYRAVHTRLGRTVALKTFPPGRAKDAVAVARFHREMAAHGKLDHPHVVRATDAGESEGVAYLVMELVEGIDLARLVRSRAPLPVSAACELCRQAAAGLQHLAGHGIVHRDLKPSNLMLGRDGTVKILDLGLALVPHESAGSGPTETGQVIGTVDFMAPEQADHARAVDARTDLYSLGCTLFYLLTGQTPYPTQHYPTLRAKLTGHAVGPIPSAREQRPDVPAELDAVLSRMMAKEPGDRYASPSQAAVALAPFCLPVDLALLAEHTANVDAEASISTPSAGLMSDPTLTFATPVDSPSKRRSWRPVAIAAAVGGIVAGMTLSRNDTPNPNIITPVEPVLAADARIAPMPRAVPEEFISAPVVPNEVVEKKDRPQVYPLAIFGFDERGPAARGVGPKVADLLFARLVANPDLYLVDRADIKKTLEEQALNISGAVKADEAARVGQLTGAKVLVTGSVVAVDKKLILVAKVIGTETTRVLGGSVDGAITDDLGMLVDRLAVEVQKTLANDIGKIVPAPVTLTDRGEALKKKLGERPRPSIAVRTTTPGDASTPAVTEAMRLAQTAGFDVLDPATGPPPVVDLQLTVLVEPAAPIGPLTPAKARIEAVAVERASGKVLATDRQTSLAVDLTPTLAGKAAVEAATALLAERVLERLVPKK